MIFLLACCIHSPNNFSIVHSLCVKSYHYTFRACNYFQVNQALGMTPGNKNWMTSNFLLLNSEKTQVIVLGPKNQE